jgi:TAG lipase/steryl ester hydrolase/phospholipase A2/LPA acyltransferase
VLTLSDIHSKIKLSRIEQQINTSTDYASWQNLAQQHDDVSGAARWRKLEQSSLYDNGEIRKRHDNLAKLLSDRNYSDLLFALNEGLHGNLEGIGRPALYHRAKTGTKYLVDSYNDLVNESLLAIAGASHRQISRRKKIDFFRRAAHCYGRSALMLSGGAGLIYFHHGVVQTLLDHDLLPNIISGSSAGSWICAQLGTHTDEELKGGHFNDLEYNFPSGKHNPLKVLMGLDKEYSASDFLEQALDQFSDDLTFQEAFEKTGRYINISISPAEKHQVSRLMNAITSPNVYIRSAVLASSSLPGVVPPATLYAKGADGKPRAYLPSRKWCDGSFADDLPAKRLARLFGVNHYLVSLINPVAIPFVHDPNLRPVRGLKRAAFDLMLQGMQELLQSAERTSAKMGANYLGPALLMADALLDQKYTGDINLILEKRDYRWRDVLFAYVNDSDNSAVDAMKMAGARSTWPKLPVIKNATQAARTIDQILIELDDGKSSNSTGKDHHPITMAI